MSEDQVQISAYVSRHTKDMLDEFARESGLKKGYVIEDALEEYITAAKGLPAEAQIPTRLVVDEESWQRIQEMLQNPPEPTQALRDLLKGL